jgi:hypothetical protein
LNRKDEIMPKNSDRKSSSSWSRSMHGGDRSTGSAGRKSSKRSSSSSSSHRK